MTCFIELFPLDLSPGLSHNRDEAGHEAEIINLHKGFMTVTSIAVCVMNAKLLVSLHLFSFT